MIVLFVIPKCSRRESVFVALVLFQNDRSPTETFGDDDFVKKRGHSELVSESTDYVVGLLYCSCCHPGKS